MSFQFVRLRKRWITLSKLVSELKYTEKRLLKFLNTVFRSYLYVVIQIKTKTCFLQCSKLYNLWRWLIFNRKLILVHLWCVTVSIFWHYVPNSTSPWFVSPFISVASIGRDLPVKSIYPWLEASISLNNVSMSTVDRESSLYFNTFLISSRVIFPSPLMSNTLKAAIILSRSMSIDT